MAIYICDLFPGDHVIMDDADAALIEKSSKDVDALKSTKLNSKLTVEMINDDNFNDYAKIQCIRITMEKILIINLDEDLFKKFFRTPVIEPVVESTPEPVVESTPDPVIEPVVKTEYFSHTMRECLPNSSTLFKYQIPLSMMVKTFAGYSELINKNDPIIIYNIVNVTNTRLLNIIVIDSVGGINSKMYSAVTHVDIKQCYYSVVCDTFCDYNKEKYHCITDGYKYFYTPRTESINYSRITETQEHLDEMIANTKNVLYF